MLGNQSGTAGAKGSTPALHAVPGGATTVTKMFENSLLGQPTELVIPVCNGKLSSAYLAELLKPFEAAMARWTKRGLPSPETPAECFPVRTTTSFEAFESLGISMDRLALTRWQLPGLVEKNEGHIPKGGHGGLWVPFRDAPNVILLAYFYRSSPSDIGMLEFEYDQVDAQILPAHHDHKILVVKRI